MTKHTIKWTDVMGNLHFIHNKDGHISVILFNGTPMHISNIDHRRAEEIRMALGDCHSADEMVTVMKGFGHRRVEAVTPAPAPAAAAPADVSPAEILWRHEGGSSVSVLIHHLASNAGIRSNSADIDTLVARAVDLVAPTPDWVAAAQEAGTSLVHLEDDGLWYYGGLETIADSDGYETIEDAARTFCEAEGISPDGAEVQDCFIVSDWLAEQLEVHGERVETNIGGMTVWSTTVAGPAPENPVIMAIAQTYDPELDKGVAPAPCM